MSVGGGGGNILRSVMATFRRDVAVTRKIDSRYAERLRRAVATRFLDTNEFALSDVPSEERFVIGARTTGRLGARHDPEVALRALEESRSEVEELFSQYSIIILIGTGGKGTGSGTMFPLAQIARQQKKLVIPIFVRPSFEQHEVDKRHYDHAVRSIEQFDTAGIRLIEILNDRGYTEHDPQPQSVVWERMNVPFARALRGLLYVLWDLSQVDASDLSILFAGHGRLRIGFGEIDPPQQDGSDPSDQLVEHAARRCCANPYYAFHKPAGTSLICIEGDWSNLVDARIKGRIAIAMGVEANSPYSPLYARAVGMPRPWGVTGLFAEYTGAHRPLEVDWSLEKGTRAGVNVHRPVVEPIAAVVDDVDVEVDRAKSPEPVAPRPAPAPPTAQKAVNPPQARVFSTFWEFAVALNRSDPAALAVAGEGATSSISLDAMELRRLLGMMWFRTVFGRLDGDWRVRLLHALIEGVTVADHAVKRGRQTVHLRELSYEELEDIGSTTLVPDWFRPELDLLIAVGRFWGADAVKRIHFVEAPEHREPSIMENLLERFR
jgi:cell division GTPase FtsZ